MGIPPKITGNARNVKEILLCISTIIDVYNVTLLKELILVIKRNVLPFSKNKEKVKNVYLIVAQLLGQFLLES